jgi:hypothetical protein
VRSGTRLHAFHPVLARLPHHLLALSGGRCAPLLAQIVPALGGQALEAPEILTHGGLLVRWQGLEFLPAIAKRLLLLGRQSMPSLEALLGLAALIRRHADPTLTPMSQRLLPLRGERVP